MTAISKDLTVYRSRFSLLAVLAGCLLFIVVLLFDWFGIYILGWFDRIPIASFAFLAFVTAVGTWMVYLLSQAKRPVVSLRSQEAVFSGFHHPLSSATIPYCSIRHVSISGDHDTVPVYLILQLDEVDDAQRHGPVWAKIKDDQVFFECSNLTIPAHQIRANLQARIPPSDSQPGESP